MHWIALQPPPDTTNVPGVQTALVDACTALAWHALHYTPMVARVDGVLVLEVSGSERLFGGRSALLGQLLTENEALEPMEHAQGATSLVALGRLWCATPGSPADALPLHTLAAARTHLPTLQRLGCRTWGQLRALPRGGLVRRFGKELVDALDRAYGRQPEVYPWLTLPEVFDMPLELAAAVEAAPALLFGARRLLAQLQVWLRARQRGVLALELVWELDARRANARHVDAHHNGSAQGRLELRTAQATQDMAHLQRLLGEQLVRVRLPSPVLFLRLRTLQTQTLAGESWSLLPDDSRKGDSLHQTLERLAARLGPEQVLCAESQADHRPERMQRWQPWTVGHGKTVAAKKVAANAYGSSVAGLIDHEAAPLGALQPTWLLPVPRRLEVIDGTPEHLGPLELLAGPQRLETGWLEGAPALRDYYIARSAQAGLVWVYQERLQLLAGMESAWYLHGLFA